MNIIVFIQRLVVFKLYGNILLLQVRFFDFNSLQSTGRSVFCGANSLVELVLIGYSSVNTVNNTKLM